MSVPADDKPDTFRNTQAADAVDYQRAKRSHSEQRSIRKVKGPGGVISVAAHRYDRCHGLKRQQDVLPADIARMYYEIGLGKRLQSAWIEFTMCVRDGADMRRGLEVQHVTDPEPS
jgi:hypothetical protein